MINSGGFKSIWLANIVQSHIIEMTEKVVQECNHYYRFYRDNIIVIFKGNWSNWQESR